MSQTVTEPSLEETLNKTDLGHMLYEKRMIIAGVLIALFLGVIAWASVSSIKTAQEQKGSKQVFDFQNDTWNQVKAGTLSTDELLVRFTALEDVAKSSAAILPLALEISKFLGEKEQAEKALQILNQVSPGPLSKFFIVHQKAVLLEKSGAIDEAIALIEDARKGKEVLMPGHLELELGRLYMVKKDFNQAKTTFESVINSYPNDEEAKLAKLYLSEIK